MTAEELRSLLARHGRVEAQPASDWNGPFRLPPALEAFYVEVGPCDVSIESPGNPYFLPSLRDLWEFQAGYRWNALTGERVDDWDDDWLVVADYGGDPLILSRETGAILFARHGRGSWDPGELFPDVTAMAACLALLGGVVADAGDAFLDEEFDIRPEHRATALRRLTEALGSSEHADTVLSWLGWG